MTHQRLETLNLRASPGKWCQFHPLYADEAKGTPVHECDTSHDLSAVHNSQRYRLGQFKFSDDAAFAEALVNAYRSGNLIWVDVA